MSQSEQISVKLTVLQQPNGSQELQSTASSNGEDAEQQGNRKSGSRQSVGVLESAKTYLYNYRQCLEVALLSIAIVVVLMLLLLPTIFYHLPLTSVSMFICLLVNPLHVLVESHNSSSADCILILLV